QHLPRTDRADELLAAPAGDHRARHRHARDRAPLRHQRPASRRAGPGRCRRLSLSRAPRTRTSHPYELICATLTRTHIPEDKTAATPSTRSALLALTLAELIVAWGCLVPPS